MSIAQEGILVKFVQGKPAKTRYDFDASMKIAEDQDAEPFSARVTKQVISAKGTKLGEVFTKFSQIHSTWKYFTHPWETGTGIMPITKLDEFMEEYRRTVREIEDLMPLALAELPEIRRSSEKRLGKMFKEGEFPTEDEIKGKFYMDVKIWPIPDNSDDIRTAGGSDTDAIVADAVKRQLADQEAAITCSTWTLFYEAVAKFLTTLENDEVKVTKRLTKGLAKALQHLPVMNITGNPDIEKVKAQAESLLRYTAEDLRTFENVRKDVAKETKEVLDKIDALM